MIRRQCTKEYKIDVVVKVVRDLHGLKKFQHLPLTEFWLGISIDEIQRMKDSRFHRIVYKYPLIDKQLRRSDLKKWLNDNGFPIPVKSACIFCPYQGDARWKDLKKNYPEQFELTVKIDEAIRDSSKKGIKDPIYLHKAKKPLKDIDFESQQDLFEEICDEGYCGI